MELLKVDINHAGYSGNTDIIKNVALSVESGELVGLIYYSLSRGLRMASLVCFFNHDNQRCLVVLARVYQEPLCLFIPLAPRNEDCGGEKSYIPDGFSGAAYSRCCGSR